MICVCAWCKKVIGFKEPHDDPRVSHGACNDCKKVLLNELQEMKRLGFEEAKPFK